MKFNKYIRKAKVLFRGLIASLVCKVLYRKGFEPSKTLVITGSTRSGSTWLAELVSSIDGHSQIFEPMYDRYVPQARDAGITRNMYLNENDIWPEGERFFKQVMSGKVVNMWTASQIPFKKAINTERLVVKFVRANLLLGWLSKNVNMLPPAMVIRHPCAIIQSQLRKGWAPSKTVILSNSYFKKYPDIKEQCQTLDKPEERAALAWCLRYHAPLSLPKPYPYTLVCYEKLVRNGEQEIRRLFDTWGLEVTDQVLQQLHKPSDTVADNSEIVSGNDPLAGWKKNLTNKQVSNILSVLEIFGLDFYSDALEPDYEKLNNFSAK